MNFFFFFFSEFVKKTKLASTHRAISLRIVDVSFFCLIDLFIFFSLLRN